MNWWLWILVGIGIYMMLILFIAAWFSGAHKKEGELMDEQLVIQPPEPTIYTLDGECYLCERVFETNERVCYLITKPADNVTRYRMVHVDCENR